MKNELDQVIADADGYRAAAALSEKTQKEELDSLHNKYQEEIVSLQHIMSGKFVFFVYVFEAETPAANLYFKTTEL